MTTPESAAGMGGGGPAAAAPSPALQAAMARLYANARAEQHQATTALIGATGEPAQLASAAAANAILLSEEYIAQSPARAQWHCRRGCWQCCHQWVSVTPVEAIAIAEALRDAFPAEWLAQLQAMVAQRVAAVAKVDSPVGYSAANIRCAFLAGDGACGIYEWRPLMCRGYHSLSFDDCRKRYDGEPTRAVPIDPFTTSAAAGLLHGMKEAVAASGRDGALYELHHAVLRALATPDAAARWARGEPLFAGCRRTFPDDP